MAARKNNPAAPAATAAAGSPPAAERRIVIERLLDAPRELVWRAWTDPAQIVQWWGPTGFTTTIEQMDVRSGGIWKFVMHGPDGTDYPNCSEFVEVVPPEHLVFEHTGGRSGAPREHFKSRWTFEAHGDGTRVVIDMLFATPQERERVVRDYGAIEGGHQTLQRLANRLAGT
jgi:uncharacterized protein YndB with AHSA1/START domain